MSEQAGRLYDKVYGFVGNFGNVGKCLSQAIDSYDNALGQLSRGPGNVMSQLDSLKTLGAKTNKSFGIEFDGDLDVDDPVEKLDSGEQE